MEQEEYSPAVSGLRSFALVAFILLIVVGGLAMLGGFAVMAVPASASSELGLTYVITGGLCILGAFGVRYLLNAFADIAEDVRAQRIMLARMQSGGVQRAASQPAPSPETPAAATSVSSNQIRNAAAQARAAAASRRPPMPTGGTMSHPPMPHIGDDDQ